MRALSLIIFFLVGCIFVLTAQQDNTVLVQEANAFTEQARTEALNNKQAAAARNFIRAASLFDRVGRTAQARGAYISAATAYEIAGDDALNDDQLIAASDFYAQSIEQHRNSKTLHDNKVANKRRQVLDRLLTYHPTGSGQTSGHIATLAISNKSPAPITLAPQVFYIPALGGYQSYVARIPAGNTIAAGETVRLPIIGYCTDAHAPPVPLGSVMPPVEQWIPVQSFLPSEKTIITEDQLAVLPIVALSPFRSADVGFLSIMPGFSSLKSDQAKVTYPNTATPIGGTFAVNDHPLLLAPLFTAFVQQIEAAVTIVQQDPSLDTPYSHDLLKEREAIIQHTIWIVTASLTETPYLKDDFEKNIHRQLQQTTGTLLENLPQEQKEKIMNGINNFWTAFHATGVAAKVLLE